MRVCSCESRFLIPTEVALEQNRYSRKILTREELALCRLLELELLVLLVEGIVLTNSQMARANARKLSCYAVNV